MAKKKRATEVPLPRVLPPPQPKGDRKLTLRRYTIAFTVLAAITSFMAGVIYAQTDYGRQGNTAAPPPTPADNTSSSNPPSPPAGNTFFQYIRDAWNSLTIYEFTDLTVGFGAAGVSTFVGLLNHESVSKSPWLVGPYGPTSTLMGSVMNFVFGSVFAYTVEENTIPLLWFLLCLSAWFFCICRVVKPKCEYNIQDGLLGLTMGKVATIPGHDGIRVAVFLICLILGVARPFMEKFEDGYRG